MFIAQSACELIGHTPMLELKKIIPNFGIRILTKIETKNPTSIKDRAVHSIIRAAIKQRKITKKTEVVEVNSGNTAIALAYCAAHPKTTFFLNQHANEVNGLAHIEKTGPEIWELTEGKIDAVIMGLGTASGI